MEEEGFGVDLAPGVDGRFAFVKYLFELASKIFVAQSLVEDDGAGTVHKPADDLALIGFQVLFDVGAEFPEGFREKVFREGFSWEELILDAGYESLDNRVGVHLGRKVFDDLADICVVNGETMVDPLLDKGKFSQFPDVAVDFPGVEALAF